MLNVREKFLPTKADDMGLQLNLEKTFTEGRVTDLGYPSTLLSAQRPHLGISPRCKTLEIFIMEHF